MSESHQQKSFANVRSLIRSSVQPSAYLRNSSRHISNRKEEIGSICSKLRWKGIKRERWVEINRNKIQKQSPFLSPSDT